MQGRLASLPMVSVIFCSIFIIASLLLTITPIPYFSSLSSPSYNDQQQQQQQQASPISPSPRVLLTEKGLLLRDQLTSIFPYNRYEKAKIPVFIWQTWKYKKEDQGFVYSLRTAQESWSRLHPSHLHVTLDDSQADDLVKSLYAPAPDVYEAYISMPLNVHRADFFRYLILFAQGGTYSDIDTDALKPVWEWLPEGGDSVEEKIGLIVGIEADPDRPDWAEWYARRVQLCQWTIRSKPGHPILADIIAKITQETLRMKQEDHLTPDTMDRTTMEYTGPGAWTDSVFDYFNNPRYITAEDRLNFDPSKVGDITHLDFTGLNTRKLVGDVLMLPITSFSPGMGHMGSNSVDDPLAFVRHRFLGSWKGQEKIKGNHAS